MALTEEEFSDLLDRGQQIAETVATPGWALLVDRVNATRAQKQRALVNGVPSWETYQSEVAWLQGAEFVLTVSETLNMEIAEYRIALAELDEP